MKLQAGMFVSSVCLEEGWACDKGYDTREEAMANAPLDLELEPEQRFYTGQVERLRFEKLNFFDTENLIEEAQEKVADEWGPDVAERFLENVTAPMHNELEKALAYTFFRWMRRNKLGLKYWSIDSIECHRGMGKEAEGDGERTGAADSGAAGDGAGPEQGTHPRAGDQGSRRRGQDDAGESCARQGAAEAAQGREDQV